MPSYITNLKQIFGNIILLYRNFLHWNISKAYIFLYANITGFVVSLPFIGIIIYQYFAHYSKLGLSVSAEEFLFSNIWTVVISIILILCIATIFICTYTYGNFLLQNVYKSYLAGEKLPYTANLYFSWKHFSAYIGVLGWISLYILAPILVGVILIIPFGIFAKTSLGLSTFVVGLVSLGVFIALIVWLLHLIIRLSFSYYTLLYSEEIGKSKVYIDESFRLTKNKVWKIIFLVLPFFILLGIIGTIAQISEDTITENRVFNALTVIQKQSGQDDHKLLEGFFNGDDEDKETFGKIEKAFEPMDHAINRDFLSASLPFIDIKTIDPNWWIFTSIYVIFSFLVLEGLTSMLYLSSYQIIVAKDKENSWVASTK